MSTQSIEVPRVTPPLAAARPTYLMCPPRLYDVAYVINPWMAGNLHASSRERAAAQWHRLHQALIEVADVEVIDPQPGSPDMVFTANAGLERNGIVVLSSFFHPERQAEEQHFRRWFHHAGYTVLDVPRETPFEGEGDALFSPDGSCLWAGYGPRTTRESHHLLARAWNIDVVPLHLIDPRFYHLDTCFAPLADGYVMYYPAAFDAASIARIEAFYPTEKRIIVAEADAVHFACNAINIGHTIILNDISRELTARLEAARFHVVPVTLSEFLKAGGAAKCLVMRLSQPAETTSYSN
ncbi:dimethylarginine dimethylaminohydrolase family protein [Edaphobacter aggregans]|uniref:dimethylarginine dimethylaminohydrolase family protein n=1 Tax=Edaphobacter aggregans TaxID=570835 RepID=UPI000558A48A|nr:arginine deiminase-related protein [Edaphobacter aggregans]